MIIQYRDGDESASLGVVDSNGDHEYFATVDADSISDVDNNLRRLGFCRAGLWHRRKGCGKTKYATIRRVGNLSSH